MATLADLVEVIKETNADALKQRDDQIAGLEMIAEAIEASGLSQEQMLEQARQQAKMLALLESINKGQKVTPSGGKEEGSEDSGIGFLGGVLGLALGGLVGAIAGYAKAWKTMMNAIMPTKLTELAARTMDSLRGFFKTVGDGFGKIISRLKSVFASDGQIGKIGQFFGRIGTAVSDFFKPLTDAFKSMRSTGSAMGTAISKIFAPITSGISKIFGFFRTVGSSLSGFTTMFKGAAKVFSKIFYPLTILMTVFDTVSGAIEGFTEGGIIGGIGGAVKGLFNSLITVPLDMLKGATAWVLDMFGFDKAAEWLSSFSFTDLFNGMIDGIVSFVNSIPEYVGAAFDSAVATVSDWFAGIGNFFSDLFDPVLEFFSGFGIPAIGFDIPLYGPVEFGPWYPFKGEDETPTTGGGATSGTPMTSDPLVAASSPFMDTAAGTTFNGVQITPEQAEAGRSAEAEGTSVELAMARAAAYERLSWWNTGLALAGADPILLLREQEGDSFNMQDLIPQAPSTPDIGTASVDVADAQRGGGAGASNNVAVSAPVINNNNTTVQRAPQPIRNGDPSNARYMIPVSP